MKEGVWSFRHPRRHRGSGKGFAHPVGRGSDVEPMCEEDAEEGVAVGEGCVGVEDGAAEVSLVQGAEGEGLASGPVPRREELARFELVRVRSRRRRPSPTQPLRRSAMSGTGRLLYSRPSQRGGWGTFRIDPTTCSGNLIRSELKPLSTEA